MSCDHAWEIVQKCFVCDAIRPMQEDTDFFHEIDRKCPTKTAAAILGKEGGKKSKRVLTTEQAVKMIEAREKKKNSKIIS